MSLFGSLMGDYEEDPFFGSHMRQMNNFMGPMFDPFGMMMGPPALTNVQGQGHRPGQDNMAMMPFGFPPMGMMGMNMNRMFPDFGNMQQQSGNCHSFTSSSVMTMTTAPDGRPQIYQESMSTKMAPGGVKETKKTVHDSRSGTKKMAIGHHIGERAHIIEKQQNYRSGDVEENQEFINLDEEEAPEFNNEWETKTRRHMGALQDGNSSRRDHRQLALPSTAPSRHSSHSRNLDRRRGNKAAAKSNALSSAESTTAVSPAEEASPVKLSSSDDDELSSPTPKSPSRKREHSPDNDVGNKRHVAPRSDD